MEQFLTSLIIALLFRSSSSANTRYVYDFSLDNMKCVGDEIEFEKDTGVESIIQCTAVCGQTPGCKGVFHKRSAATKCYGCKKKYTTPSGLSSEPGTKYYGLYGLIDQWVVSVDSFSSQLNRDGWAAKQIVGQPDVYPLYSDAGAWAQAIFDAHQYITVTFDAKVLVSGIDIYETYHAGGIRQISAVIPNPETGDSDLIPLYTSHGIQDIEHSRIFSPPVQNIGQATNTIRIDVDCSISGSYVEIDAIQLQGYHLVRA